MDADKTKDDDDEGNDPSNWTRSALVRYVRKMKAKPAPVVAKEDDEDEELEDDADDEREALADLHAEKSGRPPEIPVTDEDLPEPLRGGSGKKAKKKGE